MLSCLFSSVLYFILSERGLYNVVYFYCLSGTGSVEQVLRDGKSVCLFQWHCVFREMDTMYVQYIVVRIDRKP